MIIMCFLALFQDVKQPPEAPPFRPVWVTALEDLTTISDLVVTPDGHSFLVSVIEKRVFELGPDGEKLRGFGTAGNGPGAFQAPMKLHYFPATGTLFVADGAKRKILAFQRDGTFLREFPVVDIQIRGTYFQQNLVAFSNEKLTVAKPNRGVTVWRHQFNREKSDQNGPAHWQALLSFGPEDHADPQKMPNAGRNFIRFPWNPRVLLAKNDDDQTLYVGSTRQIHFTLVDINKGFLGRISDEAPRLPLEEEEIDHYLSGRSRALGQRYRPGQFKNPDFKPAVRAIFTAKGRVLWVQLASRFKSQYTTYRVYGATGTLRGSLTLPSSLKCLYANDQSLWAKYLDETADTWTLMKLDYSLTSN